MDPEPTINDLEDPAFLRYLKGRFPGKIEPEDMDYDMTARATTTEEQAHQYRLAQARAMIRLWKEWKASGN